MNLYGIKTCSTIRKARAWLAAHAIAHVFHDYRSDGMDGVPLRAWCDRVGWEALLNRGGTTFRALAADQRADLDQDRCLALMRAHPAIIRRPVLDTGAQIVIGFTPGRYAEILADVPGLAG